MKTVLVLFIGMLGCIPSLYADSTSATILAGWVERISIDQTHSLKAKLDSGALTSSIHAVNIKTFKKKKKTWVSFDLEFTNAKGELETVSFEKPKERGVKIKDHDDPSSRRVVVLLDFCFDGRLHEAEFTLADRSNFIYPVLLGRRFLREVAIVDSNQTFLTQEGCPKS